MCVDDEVTLCVCCCKSCAAQMFEVRPKVRVDFVIVAIRG